MEPSRKGGRMGVGTDGNSLVIGVDDGMRVGKSEDPVCVVGYVSACVSTDGYLLDGVICECGLSLLFFPVKLFVARQAF